MIALQLGINNYTVSIHLGPRSKPEDDLQVEPTAYLVMQSSLTPLGKIDTVVLDEAISLLS